MKRKIQKVVQEGRSHIGLVSLEKTLQKDLAKILQQEKLIGFFKDLNINE